MGLGKAERGIAPDPRCGNTDRQDRFGIWLRDGDECGRTGPAGFVVTAVDIAEPAIRIARDKARAAAVTAGFRVADVLKDNLGGPYDILFDRGVYHCVRTIDLKRFQEFLRKSTRPGSWWLSMAGNAKEDTDPGPPVVSEDEIRAELGPLFDILELHEFRFATKKADFRPLGWSILMRRR